MVRQKAVKKGTKKRKNRRRTGSRPASQVLSDPIRVRILEVANEIDMSPIRFLREGLAPAGSLDGLTDKAALSRLAYHFRKLSEAECLDIVSTHQRRGATEHVYSGKARAYFTDADWAKLTHEQRIGISRAMFQGLVARSEGAILAGTFDSRLDRHLTWSPLRVDERGWIDAMAVLASAFGEIQQINHDAGARLRSSEGHPIPVTVGILGFESPSDMLTALGKSKARQEHCEQER